MIAALLLAGEFLLIGLVFKHGIDFHCRSNWPHVACNLGSRGLAGLYCVAAALALFFFLKPQVFHRLLAAAGHDLRPLLFNAAGTLLTLVPVLFLRKGQGTAMRLPAFAFWFSGMALMLARLLFYLAPPGHWRRFLRDTGGTLALVVVAAPALAMQLQPIWRLDAISDATFRAVAGLIGLLGYDVIAESGGQGHRHRGVPHLGRAGLFGDRGDHPGDAVRVALSVAVPGGTALSPRADPVSAGDRRKPLPERGAHHAAADPGDRGAARPGRPRRSLVAPRARCGGGGRALPPLHRDPAAAQILPFAIFMLTAVIAPAISQSPAMLYPIRLLVLGLAVGLFLPFYRALPWRLDRDALT